MNKLYPVFEAAIMLHISESTLYRWIHQKKIEYIKIGSRVLFSEDILKKYIEQNTIIPA
jgi:DNA binding domain, excisionase family